MRADVPWVPELNGARLAVMPRPRGGEWLSDEVRSWRLAGVSRVVSLLEPHESKELGLAAEAEPCEQHGLGFTSFPVSDRGVPSSLKQTARLVWAVEADLLRGEGVAIHCRAGIGRSGLIAGCVLVELGVPAPEVFPGIARARGVEVPDTAEQVAWLGRYARAGRRARRPVR